MNDQIRTLKRSIWISLASAAVFAGSAIAITSAGFSIRSKQAAPAKVVKVNQDPIPLGRIRHEIAPAPDVTVDDVSKPPGASEAALSPVTAQYQASDQGNVDAKAPTRSQARHAMSADLASIEWVTGYHYKDRNRTMPVLQMDTVITNDLDVGIESVRYKLIWQTRLGDEIERTILLQDEPIPAGGSITQILYVEHKAVAERFESRHPGGIRTQVEIIKILLSDGTLHQFSDELTYEEAKERNRAHNQRILGPMMNFLDN